MSHLRPRAELTTHEVSNQPPPLEDYNLYRSDAALREALNRHGAGWAEAHVDAMGEELGRAETFEHGRLANVFPPVLKTHDRYGHRIDEAEFHPSYHHMMALGMRHGQHSIAWEGRKGGHAAHAAMLYMTYQVEGGVCCPLTMTYAAMPALQRQPEATEIWRKGIMSREYDPRSIPPEQKTGLTIGMAMTEKQGGSDVRANTTRAKPLGAGGPGGEYELTGHKWFCSAPMCDAFLTLAYTDEGLSCFLLPRWRPDGTRNAFQLQRLKDKLGNKSNASSEIEYHGAWAVMIGEEGRGVRTIIDMVMHTRLDCTAGPTALMRQAVAQAAHHVEHRVAFQKKLSQQPLMRNVIADLSVEQEAATAMFMAVAQAYDDGMADEEAAAFARIAVSVSKYWANKRVTPLIVEAMECLGGAGYVEETIMPRLFKEAPLNGIWEGSGNVICLDVLRAMQREPHALELFLKSLNDARGQDARLDAAVDDLAAEFGRPEGIELRARRIVEKMAMTWQGALLTAAAPTAVADAFLASRLDGDWGRAFGTLPDGLDLQPMIDRAMPAA
ncbi:MAG: DNA alkylation response protein [Rhizobiales bacterium NRL2]|jgi:putative acyl-CoA dehydrogenase|nr:MAG: DNA alkylation response protein [Rhizobiales bacterium NRL2]